MKTEEETNSFGYVMCSKCHGDGGVKYLGEYYDRKIRLTRCKFCDGFGLVDWITNIINRERSKNE
jgi:hypothetical protein